MSKTTDSDDRERDGGSTVGMVIFVWWFTMWLFTAAFAGLGFGRGLFALCAWPYCLGEAIAQAVGR